MIMDQRGNTLFNRGSGGVYNTHTMVAALWARQGAHTTRSVYRGSSSSFADGNLVDESFCCCGDVYRQNISSLVMTMGNNFKDYRRTQIERHEAGISANLVPTMNLVMY